MVEEKTETARSEQEDKVAKTICAKFGLKPVKQNRFAKNLRVAIVAIGLRECGREFCNFLVEEVMGVRVPERPVELDIPEVDELFDDIEVKEDMEDDGVG